MNRSVRSLLFTTALAVAMLAVGTASSLAASFSASEAARLAELLAVDPGDRVADVGAGDGAWALDLARRVAPGGRIWATEVTEELVSGLERAVGDSGSRDVLVVRGTQEATGLPASCCDAILLRMVYHHFEDPQAMRADLARALRPGGRLLIVDIRPQLGWRELPEVPDRGGHGIPLDDLIAEMSADGWEAVATEEAWADDPDRYAVVFRRSADQGSSPP